MNNMDANGKDNSVSIDKNLDKDTDQVGEQSGTKPPSDTRERMLTLNLKDRDSVMSIHITVKWDKSVEITFNCYPRKL